MMNPMYIHFVMIYSFSAIKILDSEYGFYYPKSVLAVTLTCVVNADVKPSKIQWTKYPAEDNWVIIIINPVWKVWRNHLPSVSNL